MSIGKAWICDHCSFVFRIENKTQYVNHLKIHAEERLKKRFKRKQINIIEEKRNGILNAKNVTDIISIISSMNMLELSHIDGCYKYLENVPRTGEFAWAYFEKLIGEITFNKCIYGKDHVYVVLNIDEINYTLLRRFIYMQQDVVFLSEDNKFLLYRYSVSKCPEFIKTLHRRHQSIEKLKE